MLLRRRVSDSPIAETDERLVRHRRWSNFDCKSKVQSSEAGVNANGVEAHAAVFLLDEEGAVFSAGVAVSRKVDLRRSGYGVKETEAVLDFLEGNFGNLVQFQPRMDRPALQRERQRAEKGRGEHRRLVFGCEVEVLQESVEVGVFLIRNLGGAVDRVRDIAVENFADERDELVADTVA